MPNLKKLPSKPGVYLFREKIMLLFLLAKIKYQKKGCILLQKTPKSGKTQTLVSLITKIDSL
jgi:excinuclease UvrABC nuclease subunit